MGKCLNCKHYKEEIVKGKTFHKCYSEKELSKLKNNKEWISVKGFHGDCTSFEPFEKKDCM